MIFRMRMIMFVAAVLFGTVGLKIFTLETKAETFVQNEATATTNSQNDSTKTIIDKAANISIPDRYLTKKFLLGKVNQRQDSDFIEIAPQHTPYKLRLLKETYSAFISMYEAAKKDGIELKIISAARTYNDQCLHWNAKWKKLTPHPDLNDDLKKTLYLLRYCSLPGISRHHWGTEIDLNSLKPSYFETQTGKKVYDWLLQNANSFGFYQPYTSRTSPNRAKGFFEEKWHWSYRPLSAPFLVKYKELVTPDDITGFTGDNTVKHLNLNEWLNSINPDLIIE